MDAIKVLTCGCCSNRGRAGSQGGAAPQGGSMTPCAFCIGYRDGVEGTAFDPTPREVATAYPSWDAGQVVQYINGVLDGYDGDAFRMFAHKDSETFPCPLTTPKEG